MKEKKPVNIFTVYVNPSPRSFCHAILEQFSQGLADVGHSNEIVDLYAMDFNPVLKGRDYPCWIERVFTYGFAYSLKPEGWKGDIKSVKDVICLRLLTRTVDGYRRIPHDRHSIDVPKVDVREDVELHLVPDVPKNVVEVRIWFKGRIEAKSPYARNGQRSLSFIYLPYQHTPPGGLWAEYK
jgi:hypothetical protein